MNLGALLSTLSGAGPAMAEGITPAMPQATPPTVMPQPEMQQQTAMPQPQMPQREGGGGFRNILGLIGDALLIHSGRAPVYGPTMAQQSKNRTMGTALANYLGNNDAALAQIFMENPDAGLKLYQMKHPAADAEPEVIRLMRAAGIDPTSDQGKGIITGRLEGGGQDATFIRELSALGIDPHSPQALELYYARNSPAGYLIKPPHGGGQDMPTFSTPEEAKASGLPPGTHFRAPNGNVYQIPGGATASPSPTFPR